MNRFWNENIDCYMNIVMNINYTVKKDQEIQLELKETNSISELNMAN